MKKYFSENLVRYNIVGNIAFLSNKYTGDWIKIPKEILEILLFSSRNKISEEDSYELISGSENKKYLSNVYKYIDKMGVLAPEPNYKRRLGFIPLVTISVTNNCNLNCSYCCTNSSNKNRCVDLSIVKIKKMIDIAVELNAKKIKISGGEPMVRKDILEILRYLRAKNNGKIILATNATLINNEKLKKISEIVDVLEISLDGYNNKTYKAIRGCSNVTYNEIKDIIFGFKNNNISEIYASMVVGKNNFREIENFKNECDSMGVTPVIRAFTRVGKANIDNTYLEDKRSIVFDINEEKQKKANVCNAGENQIFINYDGKIYPCPLLTDERFLITTIDNINNKIIDDILESKINVIKKLEDIRAINNNKCKSCENALFCVNCVYIMDKMLANKEQFVYNCNKLKR